MNSKKAKTFFNVMLTLSQVESTLSKGAETTGGIEFP